MKNPSSPTSARDRATRLPNDQELDDKELAAVSGGTFLSDTFNQIIKALGEALTTAARKQ